MARKRSRRAQKVSRARPKRVVRKSSNSLASTPAHKIGHWAFLVGTLLAVLGGFLRASVGETTLFTTLFVLGIIVGVLNVTTKETTPFLVATVALILSGVVNLGKIPLIGLWLGAVLRNIVVFVVPAAVIVALRTIWLLANKE